MEHLEIIEKLIGNVFPAGDASVDYERYDNLVVMCELVNALVTKIDNVAQERKSYEGTRKRAGEYASNFLSKTLGIQE